MHSQLTQEQEKAIQHLRNNEEGKLFSGISIETVISDFITANNLKKTNPERAAINEEKLFLLCGYSPI